MPRFYIELDDAERDEVGQEHANVEEARNSAISFLAEQLHTNKSYAYEGHWKISVRDSDRRLLLHVIVATVPAAPPINWASFD